LSGKVRENEFCKVVGTLICVPSVEPEDHYNYRCIQWRRHAGGHTNLKFGMAAPYQADEIWAVESQENH